MFTEDTETDFSTSVDVWIEATTSAIRCQASHGWWLRGIGGTDFHFELEQAKCIRCVGRADDKTAQIADILFKVGDGKC
jgi:hypothetical protein